MADESINNNGRSVEAIEDKYAKIPQQGNVGTLGNVGMDDAPYHLTCVADVQPQKVEWLWNGRIPLSKLTVLDGDPGLGKSLITLDLAARVSTGCAMPDGTISDLCDPAGVLLLSAEDDVADTIRPRLDAAGADVSRISMLIDIVRFDKEDNPTLNFPSVPADLPSIEEAIVAIDAKLVIIDPLMAYLGNRVDSNRDQDVRQALAPLVAVAERTGAAIVVVRHLNKKQGINAMYRGGGSIGIIGAARSGLLVEKDPRDPTGKRRVIASLKCNLADEPKSLLYHVGLAANNAPIIVWDGPTDLTASTLLSGLSTAEHRGALKESKDFLTELLKGGPMLQTEVESIAKAAGISGRTLDRAKSDLGIRSKKRSGDGQWEWYLPTVDDMSAKSAKDANCTVVGDVGKHADALDFIPLEET